VGISRFGSRDINVKSRAPLSNRVPLTEYKIVELDGFVCSCCIVHTEIDLLDHGAISSAFLASYPDTLGESLVAEKGTDMSGHGWL